MGTRVLFAWFVSLTAVLGSLLYSEIMGFVPCEFCWYQRIFMYPLVVLIGIGLYIEDRKLPYYVLPLSCMGILVSGLHYLHQKTNWFASTVQCTQGVPCSGEYLNWLGFITIPFQSLIAFLLITFVMLLPSKTSGR